MSIHSFSDWSFSVSSYCLFSIFYIFQFFSFTLSLVISFGLCFPSFFIITFLFLLGPFCFSFLLFVWQKSSRYISSWQQGSITLLLTSSFLLATTLSYVRYRKEKKGACHSRQNWGKGKCRVQSRKVISERYLYM